MKTFNAGTFLLIFLVGCGTPAKKVPPVPVSPEPFMLKTCGELRTLLFYIDRKIGTLSNKKDVEVLAEARGKKMAIETAIAKKCATSPDSSNSSSTTHNRKAIQEQEKLP